MVCTQRMEEGRHSSHRLIPSEGEACGWWREAENLEPSNEGSGRAPRQEPEPRTSLSSPVDEQDLEDA